MARHSRYNDMLCYWRRHLPLAKRDFAKAGGAIRAQATHPPFRDCWRLAVRDGPGSGAVSSAQCYAEGSWSLRIIPEDVMRLNSNSSLTALSVLDAHPRALRTILERFNQTLCNITLSGTWGYEWFKDRDDELAALDQLPKLVIPNLRTLFIHDDVELPLAANFLRSLNLPKSCRVELNIRYGRTPRREPERISHEMQGFVSAVFASCPSASIFVYWAPTQLYELEIHQLLQLQDGLVFAPSQLRIELVYESISTDEANIHPLEVLEALRAYELRHRLARIRCSLTCLTRASFSFIDQLPAQPITFEGIRDVMISISNDHEAKIANYVSRLLSRMNLPELFIMDVRLPELARLTDTPDSALTVSAVTLNLPRFPSLESFYLQGKTGPVCQAAVESLQAACQRQRVKCTLYRN